MLDGFIAEAEDLGLKKKPAAKKGAANKKGKSDDIGEDDVETNKDEGTAASNGVEKKSMTAAAKKNRPAAKTKQQCQYCKKKYVDIIRHVVTAHSPKTRNPYDCEFCNSVFPTKEKQSLHSSLVHGLKLKPENAEVESSKSAVFKFKNTFQEVSTSVTDSASIQGNPETPDKVSSENQENLGLEDVDTREMIEDHGLQGD